MKGYSCKPMLNDVRKLTGMDRIQHSAILEIQTTPAAFDQPDKTHIAAFYAEVTFGGCE